jgi:hypothetical protein
MITMLQDDLLLIRPAGRVDWATLHRLYRQVLEIEAGRPFSRRLVLTDAIEEISITANDIILHKMGRPDPRHPVQTAFVVSSSFLYCMARMFKALLETENNRIGIFRCLESAGQWLKADLESLTGTGRAAADPGTCQPGQCL